jgi:hypothetical protein
LDVNAAAFEWEIYATLTRGAQVQNLVYTVGTNCLRIGIVGRDRPDPKNIVNLETGETTILFPNNRSFVRLKSNSTSESHPGIPGMVSSTRPDIAAIGPTKLPSDAPVPAMPQMPMAMPPAVGPQAGAVPGKSGAPMVPMMPGFQEEPDFRAMGETTNILGQTCSRYELKGAGEVMEIWATEKLLPIHPYLASQSLELGPKRIERCWAEYLRAKKLFPFLAILKTADGQERLRFEVTNVTSKKIGDQEGSLFQVPSDYQEIEPLQF